MALKRKKTRWTEDYLRPTSEICEGENHGERENHDEVITLEIREGENHDEVIQRPTSEIREGENHDEVITSEIREGENHDEVIQLLTSEIREGAKKAKSLSSACIYRVPEEFRKLNESAYTPRLIAIGPLHRDDPHLQTLMQHVKMSYMKNLFCRLTPGMKNPKLAEQKKQMVLRECMAAMKASLDDAKKCYAEEITLDEKMMLIDGCFILEFLYRLHLYYRLHCHPKEAEHPDFSAQMELLKLETDPIFASDLIFQNIQHDLLLMENQIPFFVLEQVFKLTLRWIFPSLHENLSLPYFVRLPLVNYLMRPTKGNSTNSGSTETSCWPRDCILRVSGNKINNSKPEKKVSSRNAKRYHHILHKLHDDHIPHVQTGKEDADEKETAKEELSQIMPSASELVFAGVKFVPATENDLFKVKFTGPGGPFWWCRSAHFEIPSLKVQDSTEPLLRNFIAIEQCCPGISQHFTSYVTLMDMLVNSDADVQVLEKDGVIDNWLGAKKDITDLFNKLGIELLVGEFFFADTCNEATRYSKRLWPKHRADLTRQYFASPWKFIAFCLGFFYFLITIAQLIISIIK